MQGISVNLSINVAVLYEVQCNHLNIYMKLTGKIILSYRMSVIIGHWENLTGYTTYLNFAI